MKLTRRLSCFLFAAALCAAALQSSAQLTQPYSSTFDNTNSQVGWFYQQGVLPSWSGIAWDSTMDAGANPNSGSLKVSIPWSASGQYEYLYGYLNMDGPVTERVIAMQGRFITNIAFDIHVDPGSPIDSAGNFGSLKIGFSSSQFVSALTMPLSASNGWMHVSIPFASNTYSGVVEQFVFEMVNAAGQTSGSTLFWIDNLTTAATDNYTNSFDNAPGAYGTPNVGSSATSWLYSQGVNSANSAMGWSSNVDAGGLTTSGSLKVSIPWTNASGNSAGANLSQKMFGTFANRLSMDNGQTTSGSNFQNIYCSVLVSNTSPTNAAGNYGVLQIGFVTDVNGAWSGLTWPASLVTLNTNASTGWTNFVVPIDYTTPGLSNVSGIWLKMVTYSTNGGGLPGTTQFFVDNLGCNAAVPNPSNIAVTVQSSPAGSSFTVDGALYATPQTFAWISNSTHAISTTATQSGGTGAQYLWSSWSDAGAISHSISPAVPTTYTANFSTQYYLTMNAGAGGGVNPASGWNNSGAVVPISATANGGYSFGSWTGAGSGSYSGSSSSPSVTMNGPVTETAGFIPNISVTVQASQPGCSFSVDGTNFTASQLFSWIPGSGHTIATTTPQSGGAGIQCLWNSWSDAGAISHTISPTVGTTFTANFATQYYLSMNAGTGGSVSPASGWNNSGAVVLISAPASSGYTFTGWTGSGAGSYSGTSGSPSVTMNGPVTETAGFGANISVTVQSGPTNCAFTVDGTAYTNNATLGWLPGTVHTIATTSPQGGGAGVQYLWTNWNDAGAISHTISPSSDTAYTVNFTTQYYLAMNAGTGGVVSPSSGWFDSNTLVVLGATPYGGCVFTGWTGLGADSYSGTTNAAEQAVAMNEPITETAGFTATTGPSFTGVSQSGTNLVFNGLNPMCTSDLKCVVLSSPDLSLPLAQWMPVATNAFNADGTFCFSNAINPSQPAMYYAFAPDITVTVQASQPGCSFTVDGTLYTTPQTFSWPSNSTHAIATTSPQSGSTGIQYVWGSWSDAGAISHTVSPARGAAYTANFSTQYYLAMNAGPGGAVSPASGWDNSGAVVPILATPNGGFSFTGWTGLGADSYSGATNAASITMNEPITETASFAPNISVTVQASQPGCSFTVDGSNFTTSQTFSWLSNSTHAIATPSPQGGGAGIQYVWGSWSDSGAISHTINPASSATYTASFSTQYYLTMNAGTGGSVSPASGWNNSGAVVPMSETPTGGYNFTSWTGLGADSYSGTSTSPSVTMNGPVTETAAFTPNNLPATAAFTMSSNIGVAPFTVTFTDTSGNSPASWSWTFGDGGTSTSQNPSHAFTNIWRQTVTLTVSNINGRSSASQAVYQCFPCDALYDWTGAPGQVANVASLSNSLVAGGNTIGTFSTTNHDVPSTNLLGIIFTNLPGMTNGCPVVFSNGAIYSNFNFTSALAYSFTNNHEQFDFMFKSSLHVTNFVWIYYDTMPNVLWPAGADEWGISSVDDNIDIGAFWLNRNFGINGPIVPGNHNMNRTTEADSGYSDTAPLWQLPDRLYRLVLQLNSNGASQFGIFDTVSNILIGVVTNNSDNRAGYNIGGFCNGHTSQEPLVTNVACIMGYHDIFTINRPLTLSQFSNVVMFGP